MSIFGSIVSKIFPAHHPAIAAAATGDNRPSDFAQAAATANAQVSSPPVDVGAILTQMAQQRPDHLNWQTSIVDLMKLLGLDSSLSSRKELAKELHYDGDMNDSAAMNIWLQKQVMEKLAANGGKVPETLH